MIAQCVRIKLRLAFMCVEDSWVPIIELSTSGNWAIIESLAFKGYYHLIEVKTGMSYKQGNQIIWDLEEAKVKLLELDSQS